jgi:DNA polymerase phi
VRAHFSLHSYYIVFTQI